MEIGIKNKLRKTKGIEGDAKGVTGIFFYNQSTLILMAEVWVFSCKTGNIAHQKYPFSFPADR
jgi:hypothetical protein